MKSKLFFMGALTVVMAGAIFWNCQKDEVLMNAEDGVMLKKGKVAATETADALTWTNDVCEGVEHEFCLEFPQALKGNGAPKETNGLVQLLVEGDDPETEEVESEYYVRIEGGSGNTSYCFNYTFETAGTYSLRYKASSPDWSYTTVEVTNCGCEESFDYEVVYNDDKTEATVTFTYIPEVDMDDATLIFTFAQGVIVGGDLAEWDSNGVTKQKTMNLKACDEYVWEVTLSARCNGKGQSEVNAWTDFKVGNEWFYDEEKEEDVLNAISKKGELENIKINCSGE